MVSLTEADSLNKLDISPYQILGSVFKKGNFKKYTLSYALKSGQKYFVKTASLSDERNLETLNREISIYQTLMKTKNSYNKKDIAIPRYKTSILRNDLLSLVIQEVEGESILKRNISKRVEVYSKCIKFVRELGDKVNSEDLKLIGKRTVFQEVVMYPFLLAVSLHRNPKHFLLLLKGGKFFALNFLRILTNPRYVLTHRDLHGENILVGDKKIYIVDWENARYADSYMEYVVILLATWSSKRSRNYFLSFLEDKKKAASLIIKMATHYLTEERVPNWKKKDYLDAITWAIKV